MNPSCRCPQDFENNTPAAPVKRRDFVRLAGMGAAATLALRPWAAAMAGPFTREDFEHLVPADKKLSAAWIKSLTARGKP